MIAKKIKRIYEEARSEMLERIEEVCGDCGYGCPENCENCTLRWIVDDLTNNSRLVKQNEMRKQFVENVKQYSINELGEDPESWNGIE